MQWLDGRTRAIYICGIRKGKIVETIKEIKKRDDDQLGYEITTDQQVIQLLISNNSSCCEQWGVITTEDDISDFVGANLLFISLVDADYNTHSLIKKNDLYSEEVEAVFVDVETDKR